MAASGAPVRIEVPEGYTIVFVDDGTLKVKTDRNLTNASYKVGAGGALKITPTISTLAACPETSFGDEFLTWLAASQTFKTDGDGLVILTKANSSAIGLLFAPAP